jgi:hypothetical protein
VNLIFNQQCVCIYVCEKERAMERERERERERGLMFELFPCSFDGPCLPMLLIKCANICHVIKPNPSA